MNTLHCVLENGADLYVNERQKIQQYRARKKKEECQMVIFLTAPGALVKSAIIAMLYTHSIGNQP